MKGKSSPITQKLKGYAIALAFPVGMAIVCELICLLATGDHLIVSGVDFSSFVKNCCILTFSAVALSFGMLAGRMDLSLGSQQLFGCLIGCNIAISLGLPGFMVLIFAILFGMLAGLISGLVFAALRIPSMVNGIVMALIYESITFVFTKGQGVRFFGNAQLAILSQTSFVILFCLVVLVIITVIYGYTTFGYQYQAICSSQRISMSAGIPVVRNVLICYLLGGGLIAISGVFTTVYSSVMECVTGMGSVATTFFGLVGVIIAQYYSRYINFPIAVLFSTVGLRCLTALASALHINSAGASALQMLFLLVFTFVTGLIEVSKLNKQKKARIAEADRQWEAQSANV